MTSYQDTISFLEQNLKFRCRIPLRNRKKEIVEYAIVDAEDYQQLGRLRMNLDVGKGCKYVKYKNLRLHHMLIGKPEKGEVVDHLNGNGLDNRRCNLMHRSSSENAQNRIIDKSNTSSKYIGVCKLKDGSFQSMIKQKHLGKFEIEEEAALRYDIAAFLIYGPHAKTNMLTTFDEAQNYNLQELFSQSTKTRELPLHIIYKGEKLYAQIKYKGQTYRSKGVDTVEEVLKQKELLIEKINNEWNSKEITRNEEGLAIISVKAKDGILYTIVDDDDWHTVNRYKWQICHGYVTGLIDRKRIRLHNFLLQFVPTNNPGKVVDHISRNKLDNRKSQLRITTFKQNSQNRTSNNKYMGTKLGSSWGVVIQMTNFKLQKYGFTTQISAAVAYNVCAIIEDYVNLNSFSEEEYLNHRDEVFTNLVIDKQLLSEDEFNQIYYLLISDHSVEA